MAEPSVTPYLWATDTLFTNGPGATTENTKVVPTAPQIAEGLIGGQSVKVQHLNAALNNFSQWLEWFRAEVTNAADGGFTNGEVSLRNAVGTAGIQEMFRVPVPDGSDDLDPSGVTTGPTQFSTPGRRFHFRREVTTGASAVNLVNLGDLTSFTGSLMMEFCCQAIIAGTGVAAYCERETWIIASTGAGGASGQQVETVSQGVQVGGASAISGLSFLPSSTAYPEVILALTDSSQPRTVRVAGWVEFSTLAEAGTS